TRATCATLVSISRATSWAGGSAPSPGSGSGGLPSLVTDGCLHLLHDLFEELGGGHGGVGLRAEAVHDLHVVVHVPAVVQVQGTGEVLEVDHVGEIGRGEPQDGEGPARGGVAPAAERHDLDGDVGEAGRLQ